jgi:ribonuclease P protein component
MRTIKSTREIDTLFKEGRRASSPLLTALSRPIDDRRGPAGRVAFIAGKKLGGAVVRNRCKRVLRAGAARAGGPWAGLDVVLIARAGLATAAVDDVDAAFGDIMRRLGLGS